ncbi:MAG: 2-dehydro-3-deoxygalactonokinase [Paracoccaceae bacterium]|nr:2-dehydro-3-deoxygalactonokinase [Paracoccaceae bacterium]
MTPDWIAADWGTSNLRLWAMSEAGDILTARSSDKGMGKLAPDQFEAALLDLAGDLLPGGRVTPVVVSGMAGARQGWVEAPYASVPSKPLAGTPVVAPTTDPRLSVRILPGMSQASPADVMRGEETQIAGYLAGDPQFDGVICLPGTHTKWVHISAGEVVSFRSFMTGELFALLSSQSVLRHSVETGDWDQTAFEKAAAATMSRPQTMAADLFTLRAESLLSGLAAATARARLSGLLMGLELAGARPYWLGQRIVLIGDTRLSMLYAQLLQAQGAQPEIADATEMTLKGLTAARQTLKG